MIKNIIFDIDRTIIDSHFSEMKTLKQAIKEITNQDVADEHMNKLSVLVTDEFFELIGIDVHSDIYLSINKRWGELLEKMPLKCFVGIKELIKELYHKGCFLGIITSRNMEEFHELDNELGDVIDCFKVIVTSDLVKKPKPNKESFEFINQKYHLDLSSTVYIGDSESDKEFSNNCNISFIQAAWDREPIDDCVYVESVDDLRTMIFKVKKYKL